MPEFELKIKSRDISTLIEAVEKYNHNQDEIEKIKQAYQFAENGHKDQKRLSGEPYIIHPLEVSLILANMHMDTTTIIAALLHDIVEDTETGLSLVNKLFGEDVGILVDGVTKISTLKNMSKYHSQIDSLRKMILASMDDVRVIVIKLADKAHNMRTIQFQPEIKQQRIAQEVIDIYAPLAGRLGISKLRSELEDLAFHVLYQEEYNDVKTKVSQRRDELENYLDEVRQILNQELSGHNINGKILGRAKHYYSIFRKMRLQDKSFEEIFDIRAIRIITDEVKDCYAILGIVHTLWSPLPNRFKDYIAVPKSNMYQSLHTTVVGPEGHFLEIQIRTWEMDHTAENGIAAHWAYKEIAKKEKNKKVEEALLNEINKWRSAVKEGNNSQEFLRSLKMELHDEEIYVFTPNGDIRQLRKGATPIDFAYSIHSEVGNHCVGAKVNGNLVPFKRELKTGDVVEIITNKNGHPSESWMKIVKSSNARYKIKSWFRSQKEETEKEAPEETNKNKATNKNLIPKTLEIDNYEPLKIKSYKKKNKSGILIEGNSDIMVHLSQCCQPIPGDEVIGFITRGRGITVHKTSCPSIPHLSSEPERFVKIEWIDNENVYPVKIAIKALDRPNLLKDIIDQLSFTNSNVIRIDSGVKEGNFANLKLVIEVKNIEHIRQIIAKIKKVKNVREVYKLNEKVILK